MAIASSIIVGANLVDVSPLSTLGALCIAHAPAKRGSYEALQSTPGLGAFHGCCWRDRLLCPLRVTLVMSVHEGQSKNTKRHEGKYE